MSTNRLLDIINNKDDYTELAYCVALEESEKRNVSEKEMNEYMTEKAQQLETLNRNVYYDLSVLQKILFYFLWLPILNFAFKFNFKQDGFVLKLKQANYYSILGFAVFMLAGILSSVFDLSDIAVFAIWIAGFGPAYIFDEYFNRKKQIVKLEGLLGSQIDNKV